MQSCAYSRYNDCPFAANPTSSCQSCLHDQGVTASSLKPVCSASDTIIFIFRDTSCSVSLQHSAGNHARGHYHKHDFHPSNCSTGVWEVGHAETSEPCEQVNESSSLLGAYVQKDRYNKALYEGPKLMRKYDKAKCRAQLSCNSGGAAKKNIAISQCQQKLKKTSLSDKISSALKRR